MVNNASERQIMDHIRGRRGFEGKVASRQVFITLSDVHTEIFFLILVI